MTLAKLQQLACNLGLEVCIARTSQTELFRAIQAFSGNEPYFSTGKHYGCAEIREWRQNRRKPGAVWLR